jgi:hypothetical protein
MRRQNGDRKSRATHSFFQRGGVGPATIAPAYHGAACGDIHLHFFHALHVAQRVLHRPGAALAGHTVDSQSGSQCHVLEYPEG